MLPKPFLVSCVFAWSALIAQNPGNQTGPSTNPTLIPPGGGGGGGSTTGISLQCNILGASGTPPTLSGKSSHLGGDVPFNLPWNGKVTGVPKGRAVLQFDSTFFGPTQFQPLPSNRVLHFGIQNTCAVTYVPVSTTVGFITGLEITQGTQTSANNIPLVQGRPALLKILGCGLNLPSANYAITFTGNDGSTWNYSLTGEDLSPAVNNGAWEGDPIRRCSVFQIPQGLLVPGTQISVTMTNAPAAPFGRNDLFPSSITITPTYVFNHVPTIRVVPITIGGVLPSIMNDPSRWNAMMEKLKGLLPFGQFEVQVYSPMAYTDLLNGYLSLKGLAAFDRVTKSLYYLMGSTGPVVGIIDGNHPVAERDLRPAAYGATSYVQGSSGTMLPASTILTFPDSTLNAQIFAHEFGHQSQRHHAPSTDTDGRVAADPDYSFPYPNGNSSQGSIFTRLDSDGLSELAPSRGAYGSAAEINNAHDLMGYGGLADKRTTSDYSYLGIRQYWGSTVATFSMGLLAPKATEHPVPQTIKEALKAPDLKTFLERTEGLIWVMP